MRMEAARAENSEDVVTPRMPGSLVNPLVENAAASSRREESCSVSRFDFYTDPAAAFSVDRRRNNACNQVSTGYFTPPADHGPSSTRFSSPLPGGLLLYAEQFTYLLVSSGRQQQVSRTAIIVTCK